MGIPRVPSVVVTASDDSLADMASLVNRIVLVAQDHGPANLTPAGGVQISMDARGNIRVSYRVTHYLRRSE